MKKTLSIHLGRQLFIIEEDAYDRLQQYLQRLERSLNAETGIAEIMEDIEMRFAELLVSYLGENRKVVSIADVEKGIGSLGEPEDISDETTANEGTQQEQKDYGYRNNSDRRLYRDTENGLLGGVCAGIAAYFNIDTVIVRILFIVLSFTGVGVPVYLLLWLIVPNAVTPSDRLRMQGKKVTVDTLKDEFIRATERIKDDTLRARDRFRNSSDHIAIRTRHLLRMALKITGLAIITASILWLVFFTLAITGIIDIVPATGDSAYLSIYEFLKLGIPVSSAHQLMWLAILLLGFSGPLIAIGTGIRLFSGEIHRYVKIGLFCLSIISATGIILAIIGGIQTTRDIAVYQEIEHQHLTADTDVLEVEKMAEYSQHGKVISGGGIDFIDIRKGAVSEEGILLTYRPSRDSLFHIRHQLSARGMDKNSALKRSGRIRHTLKLTGTKLLLDPYYSFPAKDGLREQEVEVIIEVPVNKKLIINGIEIPYPTKEYQGEYYSNRPFETWETYWY